MLAGVRGQVPVRVGVPDGGETQRLPPDEPLADLPRGGWEPAPESPACLYLDILD